LFAVVAIIGEHTRCGEGYSRLLWAFIPVETETKLSICQRARLLGRYCVIFLSLSYDTSLCFPLRKASGLQQ